MHSLDLHNKCCTEAARIYPVTLSVRCGDGQPPISSSTVIQGHKLQTQEVAVADVFHGNKSIPSCNLVSQFCHCLKSSCHSCAGVSTGSCENTAARAHISWLNAGLTPCQSHFIFLNACMNNRLAALCTLLAAVVTVCDCFLNHQA